MRRSTSRTASRYSVELRRDRPARARRCRRRDLLASPSRARCAAARHARQPGPRVGAAGCRRTAARTPRAGCAASAAACWRSATRWCWCRRRRSRRRTRRRCRSISIASSSDASCVSLPELVGQDLIHRDAGVEPGLARRRRDVGQVARGRLGVRAARAARRRHAVEPAQHERSAPGTAPAPAASASARTPAPSVAGR